MKNKFHHIIPLFLLIVINSYCQISPGDLTNAHAKFEGMSNCTLCHELGEKVASSKCLDCHKEIKSLVSNKKGYHSSSEVKKKDCFQCHSEHHGRNFEMIRFDEKAFNHELTGYKLEGKHEEIDCRKCHVSENISNTTFKKKSKTFLGLDTKCLTCHDDYHQKTLSSNDCASCHDTQTFSPAKKFDHNTSEFPLKGKHTTVDCKECHAKSIKNGKDFQQFNDVDFSDCKSCHEDLHNNQLIGQCKQCHTETSFATFTGKGVFNHNTTNFTLKGSHKVIDCFSCHTKTSDPKLVFQNKVNVDENNCLACHNDEHEGKFGNECVKCHNENSFTTLKNKEAFNHNLTDYPLEGMHTKVDCKQCHKGKFTTEMEFNSCNNCHEDYHEGQFKKNGFTPDCVQCHTLDNNFTYSLFSFEEHDKTAFPLEGAHIATPCFACHVDENTKKWTFNNKGSKCITCHEDIHKSFIDEKYYPNNNCNQCHVNESWDQLNFNHSITSWELEGKHAEIKCGQCHFKFDETTKVKKQLFKTLNSECIQCHENKHDDQFAINGETDCNRCHTSKNWIPEKFDHNKTAFKLEGRHAEIACTKCHIADIVNGKTKIEYKIEKFACIDCHL